jgi:hypothetical protein
MILTYRANLSCLMTQILDHIMFLLGLNYASKPTHALIVGQDMIFFLKN